MCLLDLGSSTKLLILQFHHRKTSEFLASDQLHYLRSMLGLWVINLDS